MRRLGGRRILELRLGITGEGASLTGSWSGKLGTGVSSYKSWVKPCSEVVLMKDLFRLYIWPWTFTVPKTISERLGGRFCQETRSCS